ncbi:hypothetical protein [Caenimonas aquaedulcis]|uniref:Uncharacterized protein n=1 Tax=Caenimonas aquaedulcis TaxID=2793270 RepID=A0A931H1P2_9BURK|nr:hypothetical protein [Caenimonas aquaedulcis]MBG9386916.1 hypothetical protein [Caenimonas aquaedulcis]
MSSPRAILWVERLVWMLIYGGLFAAIIGLATKGSDPATGWWLIVIGVLIAAIGALLVWVRSRMRAGP